MSNFIYADNAATTSLSKTAFEAMKPYFSEFYGNASSLYKLGGQSQKAVDNARAVIAECINAPKPNNVFFVSGGSEADNWAIKGAAELGERKNKKHIISSKFEHHAILHTLEYLEKHGFEITLLDVHENGIVSPEELENQFALFAPIKEIVVYGLNGQITAEVYPDPEYVCDDIKAVIQEKIDEVNSGFPAAKQIVNLVIRDTEFEKTASKKIIRPKHGL